MPTGQIFSNRPIPPPLKPRRVLRPRLADESVFPVKKHEIALQALTHAVNLVELVSHWKPLTEEDRGVLQDIVQDLIDIREDMKDVRRHYPEPTTTSTRGDRT